MHTDVSDAYKSIINEDFRPVSQFVAEIDAYDTAAETGVSFAFTGMTSGSSTTQWPTEKLYVNLSTFEPGRMVVGANQHTYGDSYTLRYLLSDDLTDENGEFSTPPTLTISLASATNLTGFALEFQEDYASKMRITLSLNGTQVLQTTEENSSMIFTVYGGQYSVTCDTIQIEFLELGAAYRRLRLVSARLGVVLLLDNNNITNATYTADVDPISSTMSRYSLTITAINEDGLFNPDNPNGIWSAFGAKQKVTASMGTVVGDDIVTLPLGPLYLTSAPSVSRRAVTFEAVDCLQTFLNVPYVARLSGTPTTDLYNVVTFATIPFLDVGITKDMSESGLSAVSTSAPIDYTTTCRDVLQMAANAGRCIVYIRSNGVVTIKAQDSSATMTGYQLTYDRMFDKPYLDIKTPIKEINVSWYQYTPSDSSSVIFESDIEFTEGVPITIGIPCSADVSITSSTLEIRHDYQTAYQYVKITPLESGTSHVTITGKKYTQDVYTRTVPISNEGEPVNIDNKLITSPDMALLLANWIADHYSYRQSYSGDMRQDFLLEANDAIEIETDYGNVPIRLNHLEYTIPGQRGSYEGRRVNAVANT